MFQYTPYALLMLAASLISLVTGFVVWRRRPSAGIKSLFFMLNVIAFWSLMYGVEMLVTDPDLKLTLSYLAYLSIVSIPTTWLVFVLQYTGRDKWLIGRNHLLLFAVPATTFLVVITTAQHGAFYSEIGYTVENGIAMLVLEHGPAFWVHSAYSYVLLLSGAALLIQALFQSPQFYRGQGLWLLVGAFTPWIMNAAYIFDVNPFPGYVDGTPLAFTVTGMACAWTMYRYRLMDIMPVAKDIIIDNLISAIVVLDLNNQIVEINAKALAIVGKPAYDVIGRPAAIVFDKFPALVEQYREVEQGQAEITLPSNGKSHTYELNILPLRNRQSTLTGRVLMLHDISERKDIERMKDGFVSNVSHELRTPIASMVLDVNLLRKRPDHSDIYVDRLSRDIARLNTLVEDLLRLSRLDQDRVSLDVDTVDVAMLVAELVADRSPLAEHKGLTLRFTGEIILPPVIANAGLLGQALSVLVTNAINYTPTDGMVTIHSAHMQDDTGDWVRLQVADTGPGIASGELPLLFDRFYRGQASADAQAPGTGLGLSIAREIMERHQGRITAANREDGTGAVFTLWVPVVAVPEVSDKRQVAA